MRDFYEIVSRINRLLSPDVRVKLETRLPYWAPENQWYHLTQFINLNVEKDYFDSNSVSIYALLCNRSEEDIKESFWNLDE